MFSRPVLAMIDIETLVIDEEKREHVYQSVIDKQGPPDGTIVVALADGDDFDDDVINQILTTFGEIGEIILVRCLFKTCSSDLLEKVYKNVRLSYLLNYNCWHMAFHHFRFQDEDMLLTFREGKFALEAIKYNNKEVKMW